MIADPAGLRCLRAAGDSTRSRRFRKIASQRENVLCWLFRYSSFEERRRSRANLEVEGKGYSASIHSNNRKHEYRNV